MKITAKDILQTLTMVGEENLDIRTITMSLSLLDCADEALERTASKIYDKVCRLASSLVPTADKIAGDYGIPIINKRVSVSPIATVAAPAVATGKGADLTPLAIALDKAAKEIGVDFIGGFSALVQHGATPADMALINSIPAALSQTTHICSSVNVASTRAGINLDTIKQLSQTVLDVATLTKKQDSIGAAKLVIFANAVEDNPFMAGAFCGIGEADCTINVGVSGPGTVASALRQLPHDASIEEVAEVIKAVSFKICRAGGLIAKEATARLNADSATAHRSTAKSNEAVEAVYKQGIIDLSLAPTPAEGDSVADILEQIAVRTCGGPGTTFALALLNDSVKKGGAMAVSAVGGLSGAFIPVSEDAGMIRAVQAGVLSLEKLEAMTAVCSVGIDMVALPGDITPAALTGIIADEMAIGVINNKTTAVRIIPAIGHSIGDMLNFGGLLGSAPVMDYNQHSGTVLFDRKGHFPAPLAALRN